MSDAASHVVYEEPILTLRYEDNPNFNQYIDDAYDQVEILGSIFVPSRVLFELEIDSYRLGLQQYQQDQVQEFKDLVASSFPFPIAHSFYRVENGYENNKQRLELLRDTWEAVIHLLYAVFVSECRHAGICVATSKIKRKELFSDSLNQKLEIVKELADYTNSHGIDICCAALYSEPLIRDLRLVNGNRNDFSHVATKSELQAQQLFDEYYDTVLSILRKVLFFTDVHLMRFAGTTRANEVRFERFRGYSATKTIRPLPLTSAQASAAWDILTDRFIVISIGDKLFSASPLLHFDPQEETGHQTRLCFFKQWSGDPPSKILHFEVIGESKEIKLAADSFTDDVEAMRTLLPESQANSKQGASQL